MFEFLFFYNKMIVYKCDICKKDIERGNKSVSVEIGQPFFHYIFCDKCSKPISDFLKKKHLAVENKFEKIKK